MRSEIDDVEEIIRREILESSAQLKGQLSAALNDLETFRLGVRQVTVESLKDGKDYARQMNKLSAVAETAASRIDEAFTAKQKQAERVLELTEKTADAVDKLISKMGAADVTASKAHVDQIAAVAQGAAARIDEEFKRRQSHAETLLDLANRTSAATDTLIRRLESSELPTEKFEASLSKVGSKLADCADRLARTVDAIASRHVAQRPAWWPLRRA